MIKVKGYTIQKSPVQEWDGGVDLVWNCSLEGLSGFYIDPDDGNLCAEDRESEAPLEVIEALIEEYRNDNKKVY